VPSGKCTLAALPSPTSVQQLHNVCYTDTATDAALLSSLCDGVSTSDALVAGALDDLAVAPTAASKFKLRVDATYRGDESSLGHFRARILAIVGQGADVQ
jgi:hypothetical protein